VVAQRRGAGNVLCHSILGLPDGPAGHARCVVKDLVDEGVVEGGGGANGAEVAGPEVADRAVARAGTEGGVGVHSQHELLAEGRSGLFAKAPPSEGPRLAPQRHDERQALGVFELRRCLGDNLPRLRGRVAEVVEPAGPLFESRVEGVLEAGVKGVAALLREVERVHARRGRGGLLRPLFVVGFQAALLGRARAAGEGKVAFLPVLQAGRLVLLQFFEEGGPLLGGAHRHAPERHDLRPVLQALVLHGVPGVRRGEAKGRHVPARVGLLGGGANGIGRVAPEGHEARGAVPRASHVVNETPDGDGGGAPVVELVEDLLDGHDGGGVAVAGSAVGGQVLGGGAPCLGREHHVFGIVGGGRPVGPAAGGPVGEAAGRAVVPLGNGPVVHLGGRRVVGERGGALAVGGEGEAAPGGRAEHADLRAALVAGERVGARRAASRGGEVLLPLLGGREAARVDAFYEVHRDAVGRVGVAAGKLVEAGCVGAHAQVEGAAFGKALLRHVCRDGGQLVVAPLRLADGLEAVSEVRLQRRAVARAGAAHHARAQSHVRLGRRDRTREREGVLLGVAFPQVVLVISLSEGEEGIARFVGRPEMVRAVTLAVGRIARGAYDRRAVASFGALVAPPGLAAPRQPVGERVGVEAAVGAALALGLVVVGPRLVGAPVAPPHEDERVAVFERPVAPGAHVERDFVAPFQQAQRRRVDLADGHAGVPEGSPREAVHPVLRDGDFHKGLAPVVPGGVVAFLCRGRAKRAQEERGQRQQTCPTESTATSGKRGGDHERQTGEWTKQQSTHRRGPDQDSPHASR